MVRLPKPLEVPLVCSHAQILIPLCLWGGGISAGSNKKRVDTMAVSTLWVCYFVAIDASERVTHCIENMNVAGGFHDEPVTDAIINLEDHDCAGFFVRQSYRLATAND